MSNAITMGAIARDAGLTPDQFRQLLWRPRARRPPRRPHRTLRMPRPVAPPSWPEAR